MRDPLKKDRNKSHIASANPPEGRREQLLEAAAELFANKGYAGTSMRDIAAAVDILAGSIYYHFQSKEHILLHVYEQGVAHYTAAIRHALEQSASQEPWERLERACIAHLTTLLEGGPFTRLGKAEFLQSVPEKVAQSIVQHRDAYEREFTEIIAALSLKNERDRFYLKVFLLSGLNTAVTWYKPGISTPQDIARSFVRFMRDGVEKG